jgi:glycosyltransferase involved in cell wall biosynthesis
MNKLLFFNFDLRGGGAEKVLVNLLNNLDGEKYDITLQTVFDGGENRGNLKPHIRVKSLLNWRLRGVTQLMKLFTPAFLHRHIIREQYDIEIAYLESSPTRIVGGGRRDGRTKRIAWVHASLYPENFRCIFRSMSEMRAVYESFDMIVFVSERAMQIFKEQTGWSDLTMTVLHNTVEDDVIRAKSQEDIDIPINANVVNMCCVGKLIPVKGIDRLLRALKQLSDEGLDKWNLYLLGQGEEQESLQRYCRENGLEDRVIFLGYQQNPYKYVARMDLFVCASFKEGYSTAVTEALIVHTPVLTTDCAGMDEILDGGRYGMITDNSEEGLYEGLKQLLSSPELLAHYKQAAIERSSYFSKERAIAETEQLFDNL